MSVNDKIEVIDRLYKSWRVLSFGNYPQPFSWIDLDDEDNLSGCGMRRKELYWLVIIPATQKNNEWDFGGHLITGLAGAVKQHASSK